MYSIGNEVAETAQPRGIALTKQMTEHMHSLDSTRPVTCGVNIFFNFLSSMGFGVYSDDKAKKEAEAAAKRAAAGKAAPKKKAVGSEFFNNLAGFMGADFMKWGASLPPCDWKTKDAFANMDAAGYNWPHAGRSPVHPCGTGAGKRPAAGRLACQPHQRKAFPFRVAHVPRHPQLELARL